MTSFMWKQENSDSRILVLIPAYEPGERLLLLIDGLRERTDYGIVLVDDGSGGACAGIFEKAAEKGCAVLKHEKNRGKGAALKTGFCWIQENRRGTEVIVTADCDGQHTVKDIVRVAESVRPGSRELVLGSRTFQGEVPKKSRIGNMISRKMFALFTGVEVWDTQTGLKLFHAPVIKPVMRCVLVKRYAFDIEVLALIRHNHGKICSAPVDLVFHRVASGRIKWRDIYRMLWDTAAVFYRLHILHYYDTFHLSETEQEEEALCNNESCFSSSAPRQN